MRVDYDVNQPMEVLIEQINNAVNVATEADNPYLAEQVVTTAYNLVFKTGMFADNCKLWMRRSAGEKLGSNLRHTSPWTINKSANHSRHLRVRDTTPPTMRLYKPPIISFGFSPRSRCVHLEFTIHQFFIIPQSWQWEPYSAWDKEEISIRRRTKDDLKRPSQRLKWQSATQKPT